jgi:hypothetical protein
MAAVIQLRQLQASPAATASYDLFSKDGHTCCAKLENNSVEVFEEDESTTEVTVSWSNRVPSPATIMSCTECSDTFF